MDSGIEYMIECDTKAHRGSLMAIPAIFVGHISTIQTYLSKSSIGKKVHSDDMLLFIRLETSPLTYRKQPAQALEGFWY